jgi:GTP-binding protein EngB required for normal cell division
MMHTSPLDEDALHKRAANPALAPDPANTSAPPLGADESLRVYVRSKQEVASKIRSALELMRKLGSEERTARCQELLVKLAEDRFNLVVLGQFKRGKSSLMNAMIGRDLLPTGLLPLTSVVTALRFGPTERLVLTRDGSLPQESPLSALAEYVTERGNPGNTKKIKAAYVELPLSLLRRGLHFVDTPGVGSLREENTATTYAFLPECDAALLVTSVDTPLTELEISFLRSIREHVRKVFFVVNKTDLLAPEEREGVLAFIRDGLRAATDGGEMRLFPVSSREALEAKLAGDADRYARSGVGELEDALGDFLATEKSRTFLIAILDRTLRLLDAESAELALETRAGAASGEKRVQPAEEIARRLDDIADEARDALRDTRSRLAEWVKSSLGRELTDFLREAKDRVLAEHGMSRSGFGRESAAAVLRGAVARARNQVENELEEWLGRHEPVLRAEVEAAIAEVRTRFEGELRSVLTGATDAGRGDTTPDDISVPELQVPHWPRQHLVLPWWLSLARPAMARASLRRRFAEALGDLEASLRPSALYAFVRVIDEAVKRTATRHKARADDLRQRVSKPTVDAAGASAGSAPNPNRAFNPSQLAELNADLNRIIGDLVSLRDRLLEPDAHPTPSEAVCSAKPVEMTPALETAKAAAVQARHSQVSHGLGTRGCPTCDRISQAAFEFFAKWQYALARDEEAQRAHVATRGFCALHTWQFESVSSPQGLDLGYPPLLERVAAELKEIASLPTQEAVDRMRSLVPDPTDCLACNVLRQVETDCLTRLASHLESEQGRKEYARSQGVCLPHLLQLLGVCPSPEVAAFLVAEQARHFAEIAEDMQSYTLKFDAVRRGLQNQDEEDAHLRALIHLVGARSVVAPWRESGE